MHSLFLNESLEGTFQEIIEIIDVVIGWQTFNKNLLQMW